MPPKTKTQKMKGPEAKAILADILVQALIGTDDTRNILDIFDEDEIEELVAALRVVASDQLANKVKKQLL